MVLLFQFGHTTSDWIFTRNRQVIEIIQRQITGKLTKFKQIYSDRSVTNVTGRDL